MKKNISINISGIIFHIEEDGYETLKKYLDSINKYFSTFEDSSEILADIESRIAEIFLSKLNEEKQIITSEDVNALVLTMGSVSDFRAAEDQEEEIKTETSTGSTGGSTPPPGTGSAPSGAGAYVPPRQLMRDQKRKILGGVCAGLANYFNVDALWIRLLFAVLTFAYGITLIVYVVMWIIVPGSYDLDEPVLSKKMYRDPERKVIGGVSGGVAAYLGIDLIAVRVLFILFTFIGGLGLFIYIVLWLILPEARSLTDKMQMQGEPVTLSNIESTIKKSQSEKPAEDESTLTRIILFPFRLIGMILTGLGRVLTPLLEVIRVAIGILIAGLGLTLLFSIVVTAGILLGIFSTSALGWMSEMNEHSMPVEAFLNAFPGWTAFAAFLGAATPTIFLILLGVSVIAKRIVFSAATGWTLFALFFISVAMLSVGIPKIVYNFREDAEYRTENVYNISAPRAVLRINETGMEDYHAVRLNLEGHSGKDFRLVQSFESQGSSRARAIENARMVSYNVTFQDSILTFDSNLKFNEDAVFRAQRLEMTLFIPYNFPFTMDEGISRFINNYVDRDYLDGHTWKMTPDGLECISCPNAFEDGSVAELSDFDEIEITGKFDIRVIPGDDYSVRMTGSESAKSKYDVERVGRTLVIDYNGKRDFDWRRDLHIEEVEILITMPSLEKIEAVGVGSIRIDDFRCNDLDIDLRGPVKLRGEITAHDLTLNLTGSSEADLSGESANLTARIELASKLRAYNLAVADAFVETSGGSSAKVNVSHNLEMEQGIASEIDYRGNPTVTRHD